MRSQVLLLPFLFLLVSLLNAQPMLNARMIEAHSKEVGTEDYAVLRDRQLSDAGPQSIDTKVTRMLTGVTNPIHNGMISRTHYTKLGTMVPMMVAAQTLEAFYQAIAAKAHSSWLYTPETHEFIVTQGRIQLSFICSSAEIPWDFVAAYAQMMADNVAQGWVDIYDSVWMNPARTIGINVGLRLKDAAGF